MTSKFDERLGCSILSFGAHCDSTCAIYLAKNEVRYARMKHIDVTYNLERTLRRVRLYSLKLILKAF